MKWTISKFGLRSHNDPIASHHSQANLRSYASMPGIAGGTGAMMNRSTDDSTSPPPAPTRERRITRIPVPAIDASITTFSIPGQFIPDNETMTAFPTSATTTNVPRSVSAFTINAVASQSQDSVRQAAFPSSQSFHPSSTVAAVPQPSPAKRLRRSLSSRSKSSNKAAASHSGKPVPIPDLPPPMALPVQAQNPMPPPSFPSAAPAANPEDHPIFQPGNTGMSFVELIQSFASASNEEQEFIKQVINYDKVRQLQEELKIIRQQNFTLKNAVQAARSIIQKKEGRIEIQEAQLIGIKEALECAICMTIYDQPYFLSCGHTFCLNCLQSWFSSIKESQSTNNALLHTNSCPMCRAIVTTPSPAHVLRTVIDTYTLSSSSSPNTLLPYLQSQNSSRRQGARRQWFAHTVLLAGEQNYRAAPPPSEVVWEGIFEEELECCSGCGGVARNGECLGYAGVYGRDAVVGYQVGSGNTSGVHLRTSGSGSGLAISSGSGDGNGSGPVSTSGIGGIGWAIGHSHGQHVGQVHAQHPQYVHAQTLQQLEGVVHVQSTQSL